MSDDLRQLMGEITQHMSQFHDRLESRAKEMELMGGDSDVAKVGHGRRCHERQRQHLFIVGAALRRVIRRWRAEAEEGEEDSDDFQF